MSSSSRAQSHRGPVCGHENCRSRWYHEEGDGFTYCEAGHRQNTGPRVGQDDLSYGTQGTTYRTKHQEEREVVHRHFQGRRAFELYLLCYQHILRKHVWFLIHTKGLPVELEAIIFDLWALRLSTLKNRVDDAGDSESQTQLFSSQSEADTETEELSGPRRTRQGRAPDSSPRLIEALALCYLGSITLRLPLTCGDFLKWVREGELLYFRAIRQVPAPMKEKLPSEYHLSLDPTKLPKPGRLQRTIFDLIILYHRDHGITFPGLNHPLLSFRLMKELALPLEVYPAISQLASLVGYHYRFPTKKIDRQLRITDYPEAQIASLLVIATKLFYPFDGGKRFPLSNNEAASAVVNWDAWVQAREQHVATSDAPKETKLEHNLKITEQNVFSMSVAETDDYLNWYQKTWVDDQAHGREKDSEFHKAVLAMFPIDAPSTSPNSPSPPTVRSDENSVVAAAAASVSHPVDTPETSRIKAVQSSLQRRREIPAKEELARPGSEYIRYRTIKELPSTARAFYEAVADWAGLDSQMLCQAVFMTERKIELWDESERKQEREVSQVEG